MEGRLKANRKTSHCFGKRCGVTDNRWGRCHCYCDACEDHAEAVSDRARNAAKHVRERTGNMGRRWTGRGYA